MNWDTALFNTLNSFSGRFEWLDAAMRWCAHPSPAWLGVVLALGLWLWASWREVLLALPTVALAVAIADGIGAQLKHLVQRPRPCLVLPDVTLLTQCGGLFSFPSNHAVNSATIAAFLHALYPWSGWVSWPMVMLMGLARVFIGVHYVGDILAGWALGGLMGGGAGFLLLRWHRFRPRGLQWATPAAPETPPQSPEGGAEKGDRPPHERDRTQQSPAGPPRAESRHMSE